MLFAAGTAFSTGGPMTPNQQSQFGSTTTNDMQFQEQDTQDTLESAKRQLNDVHEGVSDRAREYGRYADETVQQNPWMAVGIGFGVGVVMGALLMMAARR
ncbi:MAG: DUF883 family protein [Betaproteobacteria bacterium]|nr:MAG: DUF883 family protein [Betaproteobacteria bacterium]